MSEPTELLQGLVDRSRRLGADPELVVHGGGNTSSKGWGVDHLGRRRRSLLVKGSGSDLATVVARDFPALWLDDLLAVQDREAMTDEEMVAYLMRCLADPTAGRPSIETLLHAFLPATHVDHTHADTICALTKTPDGPRHVAAALGDDVAYVPYVRPGFALSRLVGDLAGARAVVLAHHGLVTWGETHEESEGLTRELVDRAGRYLEADTQRTGVTEPRHAPLRDPSSTWRPARPTSCWSGCGAGSPPAAAAARCCASTSRSGGSPTVPTWPRWPPWARPPPTTSCACTPGRSSSTARPRSTRPSTPGRPPTPRSSTGTGTC